VGAKARQVEWNERAGPAANARRKLPLLTADFFARVRAALAARPSPEQLHGVRLAAKRMRYTLELFRPCYGPGLEARIESLRNMQQVLGEINDCAATRRLVERTMPVSPQRTRMERFLVSRLHKKTGELRHLWTEGLDAPGQELHWARYLARNARTPRVTRHPETGGTKTPMAADKRR
jgi:hypothetical protein